MKSQISNLKSQIFFAIFFAVVLFLPQQSLAVGEDGACGSDVDCDALLYCSGGLCRDQKSNGSACGRAAECQGGACSGGVCAEYCGDDSVCSNFGQYCEVDVCKNKVADGGDCSRHIQCVSGNCNNLGECAVSCRVQGDCPGGSHCSFGACVAGAAPKNIGAACGEDDICAAPDRCSGGICRCDPPDIGCLVDEYCTPQGNCEATKSGGASCAVNAECASGVCSGRPKTCTQEGAERQSANCCSCGNFEVFSLPPGSADEQNTACTDLCRDKDGGSVSSDAAVCAGQVLAPSTEEGAGTTEEGGGGGGGGFIPELIPAACRRGAPPTSTCGLPELVQVGINFARIILAVSGSLALLMFIYGGFKWLTAAGVAERVDEGKKILTSAVIGLIIIFGAATIINFAQQALTGAGGG